MQPNDPDPRPNDPHGNPADDALTEGYELADNDAALAGLAGASPWQASEPERLAGDLPCVQCGYNLRGQLLQGSCPECGVAVSASMRSNRLSLGDASWLAALKNGMTWMITGIFVAILLVAVALILESVSPSGVSQSIEMQGVAVVFAIILSGISCIAYWLVTTPEPGVFTNPVSRGLARWASIPGYSLSILADLLEMAQDFDLFRLAAILNMISGVMIITGFIALLVYLRKLARRVPDNALAGQTTIVMWGTIITVIAAVIAMIIAVAAVVSSINQSGRFGVGGPSPMVGLIFCPVLIGFVVFLIWWIVLTFLYRARFAQACETALRRGSAPQQGMYNSPPNW